MDNGDKSVEDMQSEDPQAAMRAARLSCLNDQEQYFGDVADGLAVISFRNEAAAVSLILQRLQAADGKKRSMQYREVHPSSSSNHNSA